MKKNSRTFGMDMVPSAARGRPVLTVAAATVAAAFGSAALAEPMLQHRNISRIADMARWTDNYVELGVGYNSKDSYKFGEWSGLREDGAYPVVGFNWLSRNHENDAAYWQVYGSGLGLETRVLSGEVGVQGRWKLTGGADRLVRSELDSGSYIHRNLGSSRLTLAPGCTGFASINGGTPNLQTAINNGTCQLTPYKVEQGRDFYRLGYSVSLTGAWDFAVNYREDVRDGTRVMGFITNTGQALPVPYEIDDQTQQVETLLSYASAKAQFQIGYTYSRYQNDLDALTITNPIRTQATAGPPPTFRNDEPNRMSLAPDNEFHQLQATGALSLGQTTRLTSKLAYAIGTQDENFLPYSINGNGTNLALLPRRSLDGELVKTLFDVSLSTRPTNDSSLKLGYQYYDYDNRTPRAEYLYWSRDSATAPAAASANTRTSAPLSWTEHKAIVDGDYYVAANTLLRGLVEYRQVDYELTDRTESETTKAGVELRRPVLDGVMGNLGYTFTQRTGSDYNKNVFFRNSYTNPTFQTSVNGGNLTNHPSVRAFMYADYDEDRVRASANWTASDTVSLQSSVDGYRQRFTGPDCAKIVDPLANNALPDLPDTCLGRTLAEGGSVNLDLQWQPEENLSLFTFLNVAETVIEQRGRTWALSTVNAPSAADTRRDWFGRSTNQDHSVGLGARWQPKETWDVGAQYVFGHSVSKAAIHQSPAPAAAVGATGNAGPLVQSTALPDAETTIHTVQLYAKWNLNRKATLRVNYLYEALESSNWAYDGITPTANGSVLMTGQLSPKYENHVIGVSVAWNGW